MRELKYFWGIMASSTCVATLDSIPKLHILVIYILVMTILTWLALISLGAAFVESRSLATAHAVDGLVCE